MARATTLFVATDGDLVRLFVAVRRALDEPITAVKRNPLMRAMVGTSSWDPGEDDEEAAISTRNPTPPPASLASLYADGGGEPIAPVIPVEGVAAEALEETAPRRLRALPHAAVVGITGLELEALTVVLLGGKRPPARIVDLLDSDGFVEALPEEVLGPLASLTDEGIAPLEEKWNASLKLTRRKVDATVVLALRVLAREALACGGNVFTHMPLST